MDLSKASPSSNIVDGLVQKPIAFKRLRDKILSLTGEYGGHGVLVIGDLIFFLYVTRGFIVRSLP
jgi:hypothetical protein